MKDIELHLDGLEENEPNYDIANDLSPAKEQKIPFTEEEEKTIQAFSEKIDLTNSNIVLQYGAGAQKKISSFSEKTLESVRTKDLGEVGDLLSDVVNELKHFDEKEQKGLAGFFTKQKNRFELMKAKYRDAESNVNHIVETLEKHQIQLLKDVSLMDQMYELNEQYFKELSMYIEAGERKLKKTREEDLVQLQETAKNSNLPLDAQKANDLSSLCNRFEKKLHDLDLTRMVSLQMAPQIRMVQSSNSIMAEKIQTTITNTIPLWKNQMVLSLGIAHTQQAIKAQKEVTDMTNTLLRQNADTLKMNTIETAKATERGIVDVETIKHTNEQLITALEEVRQIQIEGSKRRVEAKAQLQELEKDLKNRLVSNSYHDQNPTN